MTDKLSLFVFRRDLRLEDNTALIEALKNSQAVIPCFICDPRQCEPHPYRSSFALRFLAQSLEDLSVQLSQFKGKLYLFKGEAPVIIEQLIQQLSIDAVYVNTDYTPFSVSRDLTIKRIVEGCGKRFISCGDALLHEPKEISKPDGSGPYTVYTPFYKRSATIDVRKPDIFKGGCFFHQKLTEIQEVSLSAMINGCIPISPIHGGRIHALNILTQLMNFKDYDKKRDYPFLNATTHLSAHHKFGTVSVREVYHAIKKQFGSEHTLIKELYWRDFFTHIAYHFPYVFGQSFDPAYDKIQWEGEGDNFQRWCEGLTGFPIVDAGMRELNQTGFMHNRVRMIAASFLVKDLHIDWRLGERYFATKLIDYDPAVNNGNWQWVTSTGCDKQPYFRIFNPWLQQQKFDPECHYIKKWIPELVSLTAQAIHGLAKETSLFPLPQYPRPIVDHMLAKEKILKSFKACKAV